VQAEPTDRRRLLAAARLYLVIDSLDSGPRLARTVEAAITGGVAVVQLREKRRLGRQLLAAAELLRDLCREHEALFILNDRPALAAQLGADGVHLGQEDMEVRGARELVGKELLIGLSTHSPEQIDRAQRLPLDYIGVGPVYATPTKPGRPAVGLGLVGYAAEHSRLPFFAIGGIDPRNAGAVIRAGARRLAVVRAIAEAADPGAAAGELAAALAGEVEVGSAP